MLEISWKQTIFHIFGHVVTLTFDLLILQPNSSSMTQDALMTKVW